MYKRVTVGILILSLVFGALKSYHHHWIKRSKQANQARLYLNSDVCSNAKLRVQLGKFQECAQAEYELAISPSTRAMYDLLEGYSICGHQRCEALAMWIKDNKFILLGFLIFFVWVGYQWLLYHWQIQSFSTFYDRQILPIQYT